MIVNINKTRRDDEAGDIERPPGRTRLELTESRNAIADDRHVDGATRGTRAINDRPIPQQQIVHECSTKNG